MGGAAWQKLHRWVYVAAALAAAHFIMVVKSWPAEPLIYAAIVAALLLVRAGFALRKRLERFPGAAGEGRAELTMPRPTP
jgi:sulfoxide reductase heme-binding subunit YedZ